MIPEDGLLGLLKHILERKRITQCDKDLAQMYIKRYVGQNDYTDSFDRPWIRLLLARLFLLFNRKSIERKDKSKYLKELPVTKRVVNIAMQLRMNELEYD